MFIFLVLCSKKMRLPVSRVLKEWYIFNLISRMRILNTDKAANMYKNIFHIEFKITSTKVFFSISLSNFAHKCFDFGEDLVGTFVLGSAIT